MNNNTNINNNNNNNNTNNIIDYKTYDKKNITIKDVVALKLNIKIDQFKIESFQDIARYAELFTKYVPYSNFELIGGNYEFDIDTIVNCIESKGGRCLHLNIIWGLLLTEFGFDIKLVKAIENSPNKIYSIFEYHYGNIFKWVDGKYYLFDIGLGFLNYYYPIEIGNHHPIRGFSRLLPDCLYRVIENKDPTNSHSPSYILQKKLINQLDQDNNDHTFKAIFEFKLNDPVTHQLIYKRCIRFNKTTYKIPCSSILSDVGYYIFINDSFTIISPNNKRFISKIDNKDQLYFVLLKYLTLNLYNFKYFKDNIINNKYTFNNSEDTRNFLSSK